MLARVFTDARCVGDRPPPWFPERPARLERVVAGLRQAGFEILPEGRHEGAAELVRTVHAPEYVERFRHAVERGDGLLCSADNPLSPGTWEASWGAVETVLAAADWAVGGADRAAFAAVRPPGHHAEFDYAMGFCFFNNVALAAEHLRRRAGLERVAILDFDVHHGNGTQHLFEERGDVLFASLHQYPFYPGSGAAGERGRGAGEGATLNVPLPAGTDDAGYLAVLEGRVLPALRAFAPEMLLVSAGFDAWRGDPIGGMRVSLEGFADWGRLISELATEVCGGRTLSVLEGGYDLAALGELAAAYLRGLVGGAGEA